MNPARAIALLALAAPAAALAQTSYSQATVLGPPPVTLDRGSPGLLGPVRHARRSQILAGRGEAQRRQRGRSHRARKRAARRREAPALVHGCVRRGRGYNTRSAAHNRRVASHNRRVADMNLAAAMHNDSAANIGGVLQPARLSLARRRLRQQPSLERIKGVIDSFIRSLRE